MRGALRANCTGRLRTSPRSTSVCSVTAPSRERFGMRGERIAIGRELQRAEAQEPGRPGLVARRAIGARRDRVADAVGDLDAVEDARARRRAWPNHRAARRSSRSASPPPSARSSASRPARRGSGIPSRPSCRPGTPTHPGSRHRSRSPPAGAAIVTWRRHRSRAGTAGRSAGAPAQRSSCPSRCRGRSRAATPAAAAPQAHRSARAGPRSAPQQHQHPREAHASPCLG